MAQLVACLNGVQEAGGSSPLTQTKKRVISYDVARFYFIRICYSGLEGSVVNDCQWQSEPTTAPPAGGQVLSLRPKNELYLMM